jgi:hypothetical protein
MTATTTNYSKRVRLTKRQIDSSPFPSKKDRKRFLDAAIIERYTATHTIKNSVSGKSYTVAILAMDALERQMLQLRDNNKEQYDHLMSDAFEALPLEITVPTFVYWMNPYLKGLSPDDPKIRSRCASFYTSHTAKYQGFFNRLEALGLITERQQVGAEGNLGGRSRVRLWISKAIFMGTRFIYSPSALSDSGETPTPTTAPPTALIGTKAGLSSQCSYLINSNSIELKTKIQSISGVKNSSSCENVNNGDDEFLTVNDASKLAELKEIRTDAQKVHEPPPLIAPPPPMPNVNRESLRNTDFFADNTREIEERVVGIYKKYLLKGQIKGSQNRIVTELEAHEWRKMGNWCGNVLAALHREGETVFETKERILQTLEREDIRLENNPEKATIYVPVMYLNAQKTPMGEWEMAKMSLVAFHDRLHPIDAPPQYQNENFTYDDPRLRKAFRNSIKVLREMRISQTMILRHMAHKGEQIIIRTVNAVLQQQREGKIQKSVRAYMVKSLAQSGWTITKMRDILKNKDKTTTAMKTLYNLQPEVQLEILRAVAYTANKKNINTRQESYTLLCEALSNLKFK